MQNLSLFLQNYHLTNDQEVLVKKLDTFLNTRGTDCFLLEGYAGTGKTFITKGLTEYLRNIGRNYILAAPTGKAAKVIQEKTGSEAHTIHTTIYSDQDLKEYRSEADGITFKFYFELAVNLNSVDTVYIIDEASMISDIYNEMEFIRFGSGYLLQDLFRYINLDNNDHNKKIIFIGDNAQLPPVGMNFSPALNINYLKEKYRVNIERFELRNVVRQKEDSGILKNSIELRKAIKEKIFNHLILDTLYSDVEDLEHKDIIKKYLDITDKKIDKLTMIIAYSNASVSEYNQAIRKIFFDNIAQINVNDKLIILSNNSSYGIFLSNGDFCLVKQILSETEHRIIPLKRKNKEKNIVETIAVKLFFRDVILLVKDINNQIIPLKCKIIENLLFSEQPSLSSDEVKALYLDFVFRNSHLKRNTKEWKEAFKNDPYFNALRVKFGYAITCHKAQGSEWKNVLLDCRSHQSYLSEGYFRWLYTAFTRASKKIYLLNTPHINITDTLKSNKNTIHLEHINSSRIIMDEKLQQSVEDSNPFQIKDKFLFEIYKRVSIIVSSKNIKILDLVHNQNQEMYFFQRTNEQARVALYYNAKNIITSIIFFDNNNLSEMLKLILEPLKNHIFVLERDTNFNFSENFLEDFFIYLQEKINKLDIQIVNIEHLNYMERYAFKREDEIAIIDFYYNGKKQFTRSLPNTHSNSKKLIQDIIDKL